jgi:hypothetical protein
MISKRTFRVSLGVFSIVIAVCGGVFVVLPIVRVVLTLAARRHMSVRETVTVTIPGGIHEIVHSRIGINPIVAEYSRDVTFLINGGRGRTRPLAIDTCGGYPINCYLIQTANGKLLRLNDAVSEHLIDPQEQTVYLVAHVGDVAYIGELTDERTCSGWSISNNDPSTLSVTVCGKPATPMAKLLGDASERFIGTISGGFGSLRFIPVSEQPEVPIRKLRDR